MSMPGYCNSLDITPFRSLFAAHRRVQPDAAQVPAAQAARADRVQQEPALLWQLHGWCVELIGMYQQRQTLLPVLGMLRCASLQDSQADLDVSFPPLQASAP